MRLFLLHGNGADIPSAYYECRIYGSMHVLRQPLRIAEPKEIGRREPDVNDLINVLSAADLESLFGSARKNWQQHRGSDRFGGQQKLKAIQGCLRFQLI